MMERESTRSVVERSWRPACSVADCDGLAVYRGCYCAQCYEEIEALNRMRALGEAPSLAPREGLGKAIDAVVRRLWVLNLLFVAGGLLYLGWAASAAWWEWWQQ